MKLLQSAPDGGSKSGVTAYFLFESKRFGSIALLKFNAGSREAFHSHAFNALTWWLRGRVTEHHVNGVRLQWQPSFKPKLTKRSCFHKVQAHGTVWALTVRGPWVSQWQEKRGNSTVTLTHGRIELP
jgi:hypothetical protein